MGDFPANHRGYQWLSCFPHAACSGMMKVAEFLIEVTAIITKDQVRYWADFFFPVVNAPFGNLLGNMCYSLLPPNQRIQ